jgi:hypothetical protein
VHDLKSVVDNTHRTGSTGSEKTNSLNSILAVTKSFSILHRFFRWIWKSEYFGISRLLCFFTNVQWSWASQIIDRIYCWSREIPEKRYWVLYPRTEQTQQSKIGFEKLLRMWNLSTEARHRSSTESHLYCWRNSSTEIWAGISHSLYSLRPL